MLKIGTQQLSKQQVFELQDSDVGKQLAHADVSRKVQPSDVGRFVTCSDNGDHTVWDYYPAHTTRKDFHALH